jgi:hypothetical protein
MIKIGPSGEPLFIPGGKILKQIKFLHQEMPSFCYSWIWEARSVTALEKEDFLE